MAQERIQKTAAAPQERTEHVEDLPQAPEAADLSATEDLLDEIDAILETNAEGFVAQYVQAGGQ